MARLSLRHPQDKRLHVEIGDEGRGVFAEFYLFGEREPTMRFAADDEIGWEPDTKIPLFWQVVDLLTSEALRSSRSLRSTTPCRWSTRTRFRAALGTSPRWCTS